MKPESSECKRKQQKSIFCWIPSVSFFFVLTISSIDSVETEPNGYCSEGDFMEPKQNRIDTVQEEILWSQYRTKWILFRRRFHEAKTEAYPITVKQSKISSKINKVCFYSKIYFFYWLYIICFLWKLLLKIWLSKTIFLQKEQSKNLLFISSFLSFIFFFTLSAINKNKFFFHLEFTDGGKKKKEAEEDLRSYFFHFFINVVSNIC